MISKARRVFSFAEKNLSSLGADPLSPPASPSLSSDGGGGCTHTKQADSSHCFPTWGQQGFRMKTGSTFSSPILNHLLCLCPNVCFDSGEGCFIPRASRFVLSEIPNEMGRLWAGY